MNELHVMIQDCAAAANVNGAITYRHVVIELSEQQAKLLDLKHDLESYACFAFKANK